MVRTCQLLAALGPLRVVLRFYVIDSDVPTILKMPFLAPFNPKIDWRKHKVTLFGKSGKEALFFADRPSL